LRFVFSLLFLQDANAYNMLHNWYSVLAQQAPLAAVPSTRVEAAMNLPSFLEVLQFQDQVEQAARQALLEDGSRHNGLMYRAVTAQYSMQAAMFGLMFGYTAPPRLSAIRSCIHLDFVRQGSCTDPDCR
jgi:hypothetical protein